MNLLLQDSDDISSITHVSETGGESLKTLKNVGDTEEESQPVESQDTTVTGTTDSQRHTSVPESQSQEESQPTVSESPDDDNEASQEPQPELKSDWAARRRLNDSISSSSQAGEVRDHTSMDVIEHDEHLDNILQTCRNRVILQPRTRNPRLYCHELDPRPAICVITAIDDSVRLAATGGMWTVKDIEWEVVMCGNFGWKRTSSRSHKVKCSGPYFVFVRRSEMVGTPFSFGHLYKLHVQTLFRQGKVHAVVDRTLLARETALFATFLKRNDGDVKAWQAVKLVRGTVNFQQVEDNPATLTIKTRPLKRSRRLQQLEHKQLEVMAAKAAELRAEANKKSERLEAQRRRRNMQKEMKTAAAAEVDSALKKFKKAMDKSINLVKKSCSRLVTTTV